MKIKTGMNHKDKIRSVSEIRKIKSKGNENTGSD